MSDDLLLILNPRRLEPCLTALGALEIDKAWFTGYTEQQLVEEVATVVEETNYEHYIMVSDDVAPSQYALDAVREQLAMGRPVVTGYSNLVRWDDRVNLTRSPFGEMPPKFDWYTLHEVTCHPDAAIKTGYVGFSLTAMPRELWQRYPFYAFPGTIDGPPCDGAQSDVALSLRLQRDGIPMVAARSAFVYHYKEVIDDEHGRVWDLVQAELGLDGKHPNGEMLIGEVEPRVLLETGITTCA